jgi:hypothetical protein
MSETHVISALRSKRAELDGELRQTEKRIIQLRADLQSIDGAIRVFDPSLAPQTIRPKLKRAAPTHFRHGQFSKAVLDTIRRATGPMTVREIASQIVADFRLDASTVAAMNKMVVKVRGVLVAHRRVLECERRGDMLYWSLKP